ncbi:CLUMA_CG001464, isoform A [Clunio marinus]|uniref:CLUMA_CG001464, isoform A n=1 Tax=Clunio marinus TaxID=568069 RepID=A0A1J1HI10_9DIPT|nr:CLUMA_CG001464, isoform A [Clunio marinus]
MFTHSVNSKGKKNRRIVYMAFSLAADQPACYLLVHVARVSMSKKKHECEYDNKFLRCCCAKLRNA